MTTDTTEASDKKAKREKLDDDLESTGDSDKKLKPSPGSAKGAAAVEEGILSDDETTKDTDKHQ